MGLMTHCHAIKLEAKQRNIIARWKERSCFGLKDCKNDAKQARIDRHTSMWKPGDSLIRPMTLVRAQLLRALEVQNLEKYRNLINCSIRILNQSTSVLTLRSEECSSCSVQRQLVLKMASTQGTRPSDVTLCFKLELITNLFESLGCLGSLGSLGPV